MTLPTWVITVRQTRESMVGRYRPALIVLGYAMLIYINLGRTNLADGSHTIGTNWRARDAQALEERVTAINDWLDHTQDLTAMLDGDDGTTTALRSIAGVLKSKRNDFKTQAETLRNELA